MSEEPATGLSVPHARVTFPDGTEVDTDDEKIHGLLSALGIASNWGKISPMADVRPILLISGPPGAGKSSVARELVKTAAAPPIHIEGDTFWTFLAKGNAKPTKKQIARQPLTVMQAMMAATRPFARNGYEVIVDFSIGPWFLPAVRPYLREAPLDFVVLCPSKAICAKRAADRTEGRMPDYTPYESMYNAFAGAADFAQYIIHDDKMPVTKLAAYIRAAVTEGTFRVS